MRTLPFLFLAACTFRLGGETTGQNGTLKFEYSASMCSFGCSMDQPALEGSKVTIEASGPVPAGATATLSPPSLGTLTTRTGCSTSKPCIFVDVETQSAGKGTLEIRDAAGKVIDKTTLVVDRAARIDVTVSQKSTTGQITEIVANGSGGFLVSQDTKLDLHSTVFDQNNNPMVFTQHGLAHTYADKAILAPDLLPNGQYPSGATDVEPLLTGNAGQSTVTVVAHGTTKTVTFDVK